jgi:hypothetical protein
MTGRIPCRIPFLVCIQLLVALSTLHAQVRELWRTGVTNSGVPFAAYRLRTAVIDRWANTIVGGGMTTSFGYSLTSGFVTKFDSMGNRLWQAEFGTNAFNGIDALDVDDGGNVFLTIRFDPYGEQRILALIKISPDGEEMWRVAQQNVMRTSETSGVGSALKIDNAGNVFLTTILIRDLDTQTRIAEQVIAKFNAAGTNLWRTTLPGYGYFLSQDPGSKVLAIDDRERISVAGMYTGKPVFSLAPPEAFVATLGTDGQLEWWTDDYKSGSPPRLYTTLLANSKGTIAAAAQGEGTTFFSQTGRALHSASDGDELVQVTPKGGFLVGCQGRLCAFNSTGSHQQWSFAYRFSGLWGVVGDETSGWIVSGGVPADLTGVGFVNIDANGNEMWRTEFPNYGFLKYPAGYLFHNVLLRASDGTLRVIAPLSSWDPNFSIGIGVAAFGSP